MGKKLFYIDFSTMTIIALILRVVNVPLACVLDFYTLSNVKCYEFAFSVVVVQIVEFH